MEIQLNKTDENEKELLEMILQFFYENKYLESAKLLESKANIIYDQNEIQQLKFLLKNHQYDESIKFLENSNFENVQKAEVLKILKTKKFLELIKEDKKKEALEYLRNEITPLYNDHSILNKYSVLLFHREKDLLDKFLKQYFHDIHTDDLLIRRVQSMLCLSLDSNGNRILPNSRLETLMKSYIEMNDKMEIDDESFFINAGGRRNNFHFSKTFVIEKHDDEVWHLEMSRNLTFLAICSRNGMISVYQINNDSDKFTINCVSYFLAHKKYLTALQWSKNEKNILTSSADKSIKLWNPFDGKCLKTFLLHTEIVTSIKWLNEDTFVSGGIDKKMIICTTGNKVLCSELFSRIRKVLVSDSLNCLVIIPASINDVILYDYKNYGEIHRITELDPIISANISLNDDGRFLITNVSKVNASINLYDLNNFNLINKYYGHTQEQYIIECSFAGNNDEYIICGSEDASIYIWHITNSIPISVIKGHTGSVNNCIMSFYSSIPFIFSVSDDYTLRVWSDKKDIVFNDKTLTKRNKDYGETRSGFAVRDININEFNNLIDDNNSGSSENSVNDREVNSEDSE